MKTDSRRTFFKKAGLGLAGITLAHTLIAGSTSCAKNKKPTKLEYGIASYGLNRLSVDEVIALMNDLQVSKISVKSNHLPINSTPEEIIATIKKMKDNGLDPYSAGVVYMKSKEAVDNAFEYAKHAGFKMIVAVPNYDLLDYVEEKVKAYDIVIAIHNHGPDNLPYPNAMDAYNRIKDRDKRMGLCVDVAHIARAGINPVDEIKAVKDRLYDLHLRDNTLNAKEGKPCRPGTGTLNLPEIMKALSMVGYNGVYTIEYGAEMETPLTGTALTLGYLKGIEASL